MELVIDNHPVRLIDVKQFRQNHVLPESFSIRLFEDKDFTGLGRIDTGGTELNLLRQTVLSAIPSKLPFTDLLSFAGNLSTVFRVKFYEINDTIGLKSIEIDFAAAGFEDVCQAFVYGLIRKSKKQQIPLDFVGIYHEWLLGTIRISTTTHTFPYAGDLWQINTINTAYGRIGIKVTTQTDVFYVHDVVYACPAEGFMLNLLKEVCERITQASELSV